MIVIDKAAQIRRSLISTFSPFHLVRTVQNGKLFTQYEYDDSGKLASKCQTFPEGKQQVDYFYDVFGRLARQLESWGPDTEETSTTEYVYDTQGDILQCIIKDASGNILKETNKPSPDTDSTTHHRQEDIVTNSRGQSFCRFQKQEPTDTPKDHL